MGGVDDGGAHSAGKSRQGKLFPEQPLPGSSNTALGKHHGRGRKHPELFLVVGLARDDNGLIESPDEFVEIPPNAAPILRDRRGIQNGARSDC